MTLENDEKTFEVTLGSMDIKNMYPSLNIDQVCELIENQIIRSKYKIELNDEELSLLTVSVFDHDKVLTKYNKYVYKRTHKHGIKPGITSKAIIGSERERRENCMWSYPRINMPNEVSRFLFSMCMSRLVHMVMCNHFYRYGDTIYKQSTGGPIGLQLTGELARCIMADWKTP